MMPYTITSLPLGRGRILKRSIVHVVKISAPGTRDWAGAHFRSASRAWEFMGGLMEKMGYLAPIKRPVAQVVEWSALELDARKGAGVSLETKRAA